MASFRMDISGADVKIRVSLDHDLPELSHVLLCSSCIDWENHSKSTLRASFEQERYILNHPQFLHACIEPTTNALLLWCQLASDVFLLPRTITIGIISLTGLSPANTLSEKWVSIIGSNMSRNWVWIKRTIKLFQ